jgi:cysteine desulfuration protein SufE
MSGVETAIAELADEFALLTDWEERISHIIEHARGMPPLPEAERNEQNRVRGCVSQVWLVSERRAKAPGKIFFRGDSDAHLVRGEIAMLLRIFSGRTPQEILAVDPAAVFDRLGLKDALTVQRSNGLHSMIRRIQQQARAMADQNPAAS